MNKIATEYLPIYFVLKASSVIISIKIIQLIILIINSIKKMNSHILYNTNLLVLYIHTYYYLWYMAEACN